jgi:hypothetical protein
LRFFCDISLFDASITSAADFSLSIDAFKDALKEAGWLDMGRLASGKNLTKKHIFCAPEFADISKSNLRDIVEELCLKDVFVFSSNNSADTNFKNSKGLVLNSDSEKEMLVSRIRNNDGIFSTGVVMSPLSQFCEVAAREMSQDRNISLQFSKKAFELALIKAGWLNMGKLASARNSVKKQNKSI